MNHARSWLFVPGARPERFDKALAAGAGTVIIDLEDAVAPAAVRQAGAKVLLPLVESAAGMAALDEVVRARPACSAWPSAASICRPTWACATPHKTSCCSSIHPKQVAAVNALFAPSAEEAAWARRVLEAAAASGGAAVAVDGKMVDKPVLLRAEAILREAAT